MKSILKTTLLMSALCLLTHVAKAQINLVPNPSFEEYDTCPNDYGHLTATYWTSPTLGTPDYFNPCTFNVNIGVPNNSWGVQSPFSGNAYVGFGAYTPNEYFEYLQVPLIEQLLEGRRYGVSFYINLARSRYAIKTIAAFFNSVEINAGSGDPLLFAPQVEFSDSIITDTVDWTNIKGSFVASGGERYLIIGNFHSPQATTIADVNTVNNNVSYYYLDEVSVKELSVPLTMPTAFTPNGDNRNDNYYPIFFDSSLAIYSFRVYSRWGQLLHNEPSLGWDGNYRGEPQPIDSYTYAIYADIPMPDNPSERITLSKSGSFMLLR